MYDIPILLVESKVLIPSCLCRQRWGTGKPRSGLSVFILHWVHSVDWSWLWQKPGVDLCSFNLKARLDYTWTREMGIMMDMNWTLTHVTLHSTFNILWKSNCGLCCVFSCVITWLNWMSINRLLCMGWLTFIWDLILHTSLLSVFCWLAT